MLTLRPKVNVKVVDYECRFEPRWTTILGGYGLSGRDLLHWFGHLGPVSTRASLKMAILSLRPAVAVRAKRAFTASLRSGSRPFHR